MPSKINRDNFINTDVVIIATNRTVGASTGDYGNKGTSYFYECEGYEKMALHLKNDASTNASITVDWSIDGVTSSQNEIVKSDSSITKTGITDIKAPYFRVYMNNSDSVSHVFNAWVFLR